MNEGQVDVREEGHKEEWKHVPDADLGDTDGRIHIIISSPICGQWIEYLNCIYFSY